jgi:hypothetical protein
MTRVQVILPTKYIPLTDQEIQAILDRLKAQKEKTKQYIKVDSLEVLNG